MRRVWDNIMWWALVVAAVACIYGYMLMLDSAYMS
jgi:hypothetical protein